MYTVYYECVCVYVQMCISQGYVDALNALGWYYGIMGGNKRKAAYYFDLAARNGSRDGLFNLGVYHLNGAVPDLLGQNEVGIMRYTNLLV